VMKLTCYGGHYLIMTEVRMSIPDRTGSLMS